MRVTAGETADTEGLAALRVFTHAAEVWLVPTVVDEITRDGSPEEQSWRDLRIGEIHDDSDSYHGCVTTKTYRYMDYHAGIYSGIVRLLDLALCAGDGAVHRLYVVAPDNREANVRTQLQRPAFKGIARLQVRFLPYSEFERHREAMARFGTGLKRIDAVARTLTSLTSCR